MVSGSQKNGDRETFYTMFILFCLRVKRKAGQPKLLRNSALAKLPGYTNLVPNLPDR